MDIAPSPFERALIILSERIESLGIEAWGLEFDGSSEASRVYWYPAATDRDLDARLNVGIEYEPFFREEGYIPDVKIGNVEYANVLKLSTICHIVIHVRDARVNSERSGNSIQSVYQRAYAKIYKAIKDDIAYTDSDGFSVLYENRRSESSAIHPSGEAIGSKIGVKMIFPAYEDTDISRKLYIRPELVYVGLPENVEI